VPHGRPWTDASDQSFVKIMENRFTSPYAKSRYSNGGNGQ
jgi:hypothetical protein